MRCPARAHRRRSSPGLLKLAKLNYSVAKQMAGSKFKQFYNIKLFVEQMKHLIFRISTIP